MPRSYPSVDETIETVKRSNLPTLVTEGRDDYIVFRRLEDRLAGGISVLPVGGRDKVLQVFRRREEIGHTRVAFVVDRDLWCLGQTPDEVLSEQMILTDGYSIENDVFRDAAVPSLMSNEERLSFNLEVQRVNRWYALAVNRILGGNDCRLDIHPSEILDLPGRFEELTALGAAEEYPEQLFTTITDRSEELLRGKTLFQVAMRQLAARGRLAKHHHHQIMDQAAARRGPLLDRLSSAVERVLAPA